MKYHFVADMRFDNQKKVLSDMRAFEKLYLNNLSEGYCIVICKDVEEVYKCKTEIANEIKVIEVPDSYSEDLIKILENLMDAEDLYIFGNDVASVELSVKIGYRKNGSYLNDVTELEYEEEKIFAKKLVYSGNMEGRFYLQKPPFLISIAKGSSRESEIREYAGKITEKTLSQKKFTFVKKQDIIRCKEERNIESAKIVVVAGRGVGSKKKVEELETIAKRMGGELGVTRPVAMNAWSSLSNLIGASGHLIAPDICIVAGASGQAAFYLGIEKSNMIIAINEDRNAPIMKKADVIIVHDYESILNELEKFMGGR